MHVYHQCFLKTPKITKTQFTQQFIKVKNDGFITLLKDLVVSQFTQNNINNLINLNIQKGTQLLITWNLAGLMWIICNNKY